MKRHSALGRILALSGLAAIAAGCGAPPTLSVAEKPAPRYAPLQAPGPQQQAQQPEVTDLFPFLEGIGLTARQKRQIRTLLEQQEPPSSEEQAGQRSQRFLALLSSRELDEDALGTLFTAALEESRQQTRESVTLFANLRALLTEEQQEEAASKIRRQLEQAQRQAQQQQPQGQQPQGQQLDLQLTQAQQEAFNALRPDQGPEAMANALADFFENGDEEALEAAMIGEASVEARVEAMVAAYASLSYRQRQQLVNHLQQQARQAQQQAGQSAGSQPVGG